MCHVLHTAESSLCRNRQGVVSLFDTDGTHLSDLNQSLTQKYDAETADKTTQKAANSVKGSFIEDVSPFRNKMEGKSTLTHCIQY